MRSVVIKLFSICKRSSAGFVASVVFVALLAAAIQVIGQSNVSSRPSTGPVRKWELLAHGNSERLWYAVTPPATGEDGLHTFVRERDMQTAWRDVISFPSRLIAVGDLRGQLVASMEDGEWKRISDDQFASGLPLPGHGDILALAGDEGSLWAIGFAEGAMPHTVRGPATRAATQPATKVASSTTLPEQLQLYKLSGEKWARVAAVPPDVKTGSGNDLSLVICKGALAIAYKETATTARIMRFDAAKQSWIGIGMIGASTPLRKLKLLAAHDKLIAWTVGDVGVGAFHFPQADEGADTTWKSEALAMQASVMDVSATAAKDELHLFVVRPDEEFVEQLYDLSGHLKPNSLAKLAPPVNPEETTISDVLNRGLLGLLMIVTLVAANRNGPVQVVSLNKVEIGIAPLALRLAAGMIDLFPGYICIFATVAHYHHGIKLSQMYTDRYAMWAEGIAVAGYFLHTLVGEMIWGRTVGKMCVGLRVSGIDGKKAPMGSIILRNLMRIIEVPGMLGLPLIVIFFSPLHQRLGDLAAGTIVTAKVPKKITKESDLLDAA
jgi:uncharacterized RDD family membrane protein YckC